MRAGTKDGESLNVWGGDAGILECTSRMTEERVRIMPRFLDGDGGSVMNYNVTRKHI